MQETNLKQPIIMRNTSFSKMAVLPAGLLTLALTMPSCSSNEYKKHEGDKAKQVASIIRNCSFLWKVAGYRSGCAG